MIGVLVLEQIRHEDAVEERDKHFPPERNTYECSLRAGVDMETTAATHGPLYYRRLAIKNVKEKESCEFPRVSRISTIMCKSTEKRFYNRIVHRIRALGS
jgi:hypothetical protein